MASPGLEPETFSVLDWRDNQLHHDTIYDGFAISFSEFHSLWLMSIDHSIIFFWDEIKYKNSSVNNNKTTPILSC